MVGGEQVGRRGKRICLLHLQSLFHSGSFRGQTHSSISANPPLIQRIFLPLNDSLWEKKCQLFRDWLLWLRAASWAGGRTQPLPGQVSKASGSFLLGILVSTIWCLAGYTPLYQHLFPRDRASPLLLVILSHLRWEESAFGMACGKDADELLKSSGTKLQDSLRRSVEKERYSPGRCWGLLQFESVWEKSLFLHLPF